MKFLVDNALSPHYGGPVEFFGNTTTALVVDAGGYVYVTGGICLSTVFDPAFGIECAASDYATIKYVQK